MTERLYIPISLKQSQLRLLTAADGWFIGGLLGLETAITFDALDACDAK